MRKKKMEEVEQRTFEERRERLDSTLKQISELVRSYREGKISQEEFIRALERLPKELVELIKELVAIEVEKPLPPEEELLGITPEVELRLGADWKAELIKRGIPPRRVREYRPVFESLLRRLREELEELPPEEVYRRARGQLLREAERLFVKTPPEVIELLLKEAEDYWMRKVIDPLAQRHREAAEAYERTKSEQARRLAREYEEMLRRREWQLIQPLIEKELNTRFTKEENRRKMYTALRRLEREIAREEERLIRAVKEAVRPTHAPVTQGRIPKFFDWLQEVKRIPRTELWRIYRDQQLWEQLLKEYREWLRDYMKRTFGAEME